MNAIKWKRKGKCLVVSSLFAAGMAVAPQVLAQISTATVRGNVTVNSAPVKAGARVVARNVNTGTTVQATTRDDGSYVLPGLNPGTYSIEVTAEGAATRTENIVLRVGEQASLDLSLSAAARMEQITVVGAANRL